MLLRVLACCSSLLLGVPGLSQRGFAQESAAQPVPSAAQPAAAPSPAGRKRPPQTDRAAAGKHRGTSEESRSERGNRSGHCHRR